MGNLERENHASLISPHEVWRKSQDECQIVEADGKAFHHRSPARHGDFHSVWNWLRRGQTAHCGSLLSELSPNKRVLSHRPDGSCCDLSTRSIPPKARQRPFLRRSRMTKRAEFNLNGARKSLRKLLRSCVLHCSSTSEGVLSQLSSCSPCSPSSTLLGAVMLTAQAQNTTSKGA